jgi:predicted transcriptional regulator
MERNDAKLMLKIYKLQKELKRDVQTGDLVSRMILPKGSCQKKLEELLNKGFLTESVFRGANQYAVSSQGKNYMSAYRDIKLEM